MSINWVMLARDGEIVKLPGETIHYKVRSRIALDVTTEPASDVALHSDGGILYLTNLRLVYLPAQPTAALRSFSAPILDVADSRVVSRFFGPWAWAALVRPTPGGGVPAAAARLAVRLTFRDGGHDAFQGAFVACKERLADARALAAETGQAIPAEDLPRYEPADVPGGGTTGAGAGTTTAGTGTGTGTAGTATATTDTGTDSETGTTTTTTTTTTGPQPGESSASAKEREALGAYADAHEQAAAEQPPEPRNEAAEAEAAQQGLLQARTATDAAPRLTPTPDEPPPDYEEAQAQAVDMRLEARLREEAER